MAEYKDPNEDIIFTTPEERESFKDIYPPKKTKITASDAASEDDGAETVIAVNRSTGAKVILTQEKNVLGERLAVVELRGRRSDAKIPEAFLKHPGWSEPG